MSAADFKAVCRRLEREPEFGKPLSRELTGLRKVRVGGVENRLVYSYDALTDTVTVIAVGRRRDNAVYNTAGKRI